MPKETGETLCETRGNVRGNGGEGGHVGNWRLQGFLRHLVTSFQAASYIDGTTNECRGIFIVFPAHFPAHVVKQSEISARSKVTEALDFHVSTCIYSAIYLIYSDIREFILQQIFNELIGEKLGSSQ